MTERRRSDLENREDTALSGGGSVIKPLLSMICRWGAVMTAFCFAVTLLWGFKFSQLLGFGIGYAFMCGQYLYFGRCCETAVTLDRKAAVRKMRTCYALRMSALVLISCAAAYTGLANFTGVLIPQLFPRMILTADHFIGRKG